MRMVYQQLTILCHLLVRDIYIWKKRFFSELIDVTGVSLSDILLFGIMLPTMGVTQLQAAAYYIGTVVQVAFMAHYYHATTLVLEYTEGKHIQANLVLPIHLITLITRFVIVGVIKATLITVLPLLVGLWFFGTLQALTMGQIMALLAFLTGSQVTLSVFFVSLGLTQSSQWLFTDAWPRLLGPVMNLGCLFYMYTDLRAIYPRASILFLLNPLVSIAEGIRSLTHLPFALPMPLGMLLLSLFTGIFFGIGYTTIQKRLDCLA